MALFGTSYISAHDLSSCHSLGASQVMLLPTLLHNSLVLLPFFISSFFVVTCLYVFSLRLLDGQRYEGRKHIQLLSILHILGRHCRLVLLRIEMCSGSRCAARRRIFSSNLVLLYFETQTCSIKLTHKKGDQSGPKQGVT